MLGGGIQAMAGGIAAGTALVRILPDFTGFGGKLQAGVMSATSGISNKLSAVGGSLTKKLTLPLLAVGAASFKVASDFEASMSQIEGLVGLSSTAVAQLSDEVLKLGPAVGKSPKELADALYFITSAGFDAKDAMVVLEISAKAAAAGLGETEVVADALTSAMNAYGKENLSAARAADIMVAAVKEGKVEADALAGVLGNLVPTAAALNIGFDDLAGTMAVLSKTGTGAEEGATQISAVMSALLSDSPKVVDALEEVGLTVGQLREEAGEKGLIYVMRHLDEAFGGNVEAMRQVFPNVRAFRAVMNALAQSGEDVDDVLEGVTKSTGALDLGFKAASNTAKFKMNAAMSALQAAGIRLGAALAPAITAIARFVGRLAGAFASLPPGAQKVIGIIMAVVAALGPLLIISAKIATAFKTLKIAEGFGKIGGAVGKLRGAMDTLRLMGMYAMDSAKKAASAAASWVASMARIAAAAVANAARAVASTVVSAATMIASWVATAASAVASAAVIAASWLVAAAPFILIGALIAGLVYIVIRNWTTIKDFLLAVWNGIKNTAVAIWNGLVAFFKRWGILVLGALLGPIALIVALIIKNWNTIKAITSAVWNAIKSALSAVWNAIKGAASAVWNGIKAVISGAINTVRSIISGAASFIRSAWSGAMNSLRSAASAAWNAVKSIFTGAWNFVKGIVDKITGAFSKLAFWRSSPSPLEVHASKTVEGIKRSFADLYRNFPTTTTPIATARPAAAAQSGDITAALERALGRREGDRHYNLTVNARESIGTATNNFRLMEAMGA